VREDLEDGLREGWKWATAVPEEPPFRAPLTHGLAVCGVVALILGAILDVGGVVTVAAGLLLLGAGCAASALNAHAALDAHARAANVPRTVLQELRAAEERFARHGLAVLRASRDTMAYAPAFSWTFAALGAVAMLHAWYSGFVASFWAGAVLILVGAALEERWRVAALTLATWSVAVSLAIAVRATVSDQLAFLGIGLAAWGLVVAVWLATVHVVLRARLFSLVLNVGVSLHQGLSAVSSTVRTAPVTLALLFVVFLTEDVWRVVNAMPWWRYALTLAVLIALCALTARNAAREVVVSRLTTRHPTPLARELERHCAEIAGDRPARRDPSPRQERDLRLALMSAIFGRLLLVFGLVTFTFAFIGVVAVGANVGIFLDDARPHEVALGLHSEAFGVAALLGAVAALTFGAGASVSREKRELLMRGQRKRLAERIGEWRPYMELRDHYLPNGGRTPWEVHD
jgi:hypothetical protein